MIVAFIGLGNMGLPMARNVVQAGFAVHAYNRSPEKSKAIESTGAKAFASPEDVVKEAEVVITMLSDDAAVNAIADKIIPAMKKGSIHVSMSTIGAAASAELAKRFETHGLFYVSAPVMGRPPA